MDTEQLVLYVFFAGIALFMVRRWLMTRSIRQYTPEDARELVRKGEAVLVDVRTSGERSRSTITGSTHIPLGELGRRHDELERFRDKEIIFFCATGSRSLIAAGKAGKRGLKVANLSGGIGLWNLSAR